MFKSDDYLTNFYTYDDTLCVSDIADTEVIDYEQEQEQKMFDTMSYVDSTLDACSYAYNDMQRAYWTLQSVRDRAYSISATRYDKISVQSSVRDYDSSVVSILDAESTYNEMCHRYACECAILWDRLVQSGLKQNQFLVMWYKYSYQIGATTYARIGQCVGLSASAVESCYRRAYKNYARHMIEKRKELQ